MRTSVLLLFTSVALIGNAAPPADNPAAEPLRLYVVTGGHDYHMSFYRVFEYPDFRVNLHPHPGAFQGDLRKRVDVLVLYDMAQVKEIGDQGQKNLRDFLESGKGLVVLHHAIFDYGDWEWYWHEVSGVRQNPNRDRSQPDYVHDVKLQIEPVATHPILSGIGPFQIIDETYKGLLVAPENTILLTGNRCFCNSPLTDPHSTAAGFGPVCADHYGLKEQVEKRGEESGSTGGIKRRSRSSSYSSPRRVYGRRAGLGREVMQLRQQRYMLK